MSSLELEVQSLKDIVAGIGNDFTDPDDDWMGCVIMKGEHGNAMLPLLFGDDDEKEMIATEVIPQMIRMVRPWFVGQLQSAWTVKINHPKDKPVETILQTYAEMGITAPSQHPDRVEVLILIGVTADQVQSWSAEINRHQDAPPTLSDWAMWPSDANTRGRFIDPIVETLKEIQE